MNPEQVRQLIAIVCYCVNRNSIHHLVYAKNKAKETAMGATGNYSQSRFDIELSSGDRLKVIRQPADNAFSIHHNSYGLIAEVEVKSDRAKKAKDVKNGENYSSVEVSSSEIKVGSYSFRAEV